MIKSEYQEYLKSDHWLKIKKSHYKLKKNRFCFICLSKENLHIHHKYYYRKKYGVTLHKEQAIPHVLVTLCLDCHFLWHKYHSKSKFKTKYRDRIYILQSLHFSKEDCFKYCLGGIYNKVKKQATKATALLSHDPTERIKPREEVGTHNSWDEMRNVNAV